MQTAPAKVDGREFLCYIETRNGRTVYLDKALADWYGDPQAMMNEEFKLLQKEKA